MKRWLNALPLLPFLVLAAAAQNPIRVACIGDSITYGDKLAERDVQSYPAVLERLSQGRFAVGNFGANGTTALPDTGRAWIDAPACRDALAFAPDVVVALIGINDFLGYSDRFDRYPAALRDIVARFQALPSAPRVFLCTLVPLAPAEQMAAANRIVRDTLNPAIRAVASETGAQVIDVAALFSGREDLMADNLHPTPAGAELIARAVLAAVDAAAPAPHIQPAPVAGPVDISIRNEAFAARSRAEQWMKNRPAPTHLLRPPTGNKADDLLPLLAGQPAETGENLFFLYAALAAVLERAGQETVFLADGAPVAWREALLHQLVQRQRIDSQGGGFWSDPAAPDPARDAGQSTAYALRALALALGE